MQLTDEEVYEILLKDCQDQTDSIQKYFEENQSEQIKIDVKDFYEEREDYESIQEKLYEEKKKLEDMFLELNLDIQRKKKILNENQEELDKSSKLTQKLDKKIQEKIEFIDFLQEQIKILNLKLK